LATGLLASLSVLLLGVLFVREYQQKNELMEYFQARQDWAGQYSLWAWEALGRGDYQRATEVAEQCTQAFGEQADRAQQRLAKSGLPPPPVGALTKDQVGEIVARRVLNIVGACYLIKGDAAERLQRHDEAREAWRAAAKYTYARCWSPQGFFWSPSQAALERLLAR
jgi:tetratricopeptide (TPR) repeat protein